MDVANVDMECGWQHVIVPTMMHTCTLRRQFCAVNAVVCTYTVAKQTHARAHTTCMHADELKASLRKWTDLAEERIREKEAAEEKVRA